MSDSPQHAELLLRLSPAGDLDLSEGTEARADLEVAGFALDLAWAQRDELLAELLPDTSVQLLARYEELYAIHRIGSRPDSVRQARLIAARQRVPNSRPATIIELVETWSGGTVDSITELDGFRCDDADSLTDTDGDVLDGYFLFYVEADAASMRTAAADRDELQELVDAVKPAHVTGVLRCDDFACDDTWSLTDTDLLGA